MNDAHRVYLDHNATSPLRPEAASAMRPYLDRSPANPSSLHREGRAAQDAVESARERVARLLNCSSKEVVFTSGGSEAISAAIRGVCDRAPDDLRRIVVPEIEHSAVLEAARSAVRRGFLMVSVPCGAEGRVDVERFRMQLGPGVALAVLQWANNETGVVQPLEEIGRACREHRIPFLIDAVQAAGKVPLEPATVFADLVAVSGHKFGGPQGAGALMVRSGIQLAALVSGGAQEMRRRGGTPGVASLVGFGAAAAAVGANAKEEKGTQLRLRAKIETRLRERYPSIRFHGQAAPRVPNTVNFALPGVPGEALAIALDLAGVAVSTGSACASGAVEPSHVLRAMGLDDDQVRGAVRLSLGWNTTADDVDRFLGILPGVVDQVCQGLKRG